MSKRFPQYLKIEGGPTILFILFYLFYLIYFVFLILFLFRLYGVMYRGFTRSEAVGLVCKLLRQAFNGRLFWTRCPVFSTAALPGDI